MGVDAPFEARPLIHMALQMRTAPSALPNIVIPNASFTRPRSMHACKVHNCQDQAGCTPLSTLRALNVCRLDTYLDLLGQRVGQVLKLVKNGRHLHVE